MATNGYSAPTGRELKQQFEATFNNEIDGPDADFEAGTIMGALSVAFTEVAGNLAEKTQQLYDQRRIQNATGLDLEDLVLIAGITREEATTSTVELVASGTSTPIPTDAEVRGPNGFKWVNAETSEITSPPDSVTFACETDGPINVPAGATWKIIKPIAGVDGFDNPNPAQPGQPKENDAQLLRRRNNQFARGTTRQVGSLRAALEQVELINHQVVVENRAETEQVVQGLTIQPHSFIVVIEPSNLSSDEKQQVAETIYEYGPEAINTDPDNYDNEVTVVASDGTDYDVRWLDAQINEIDVRVKTDYTFSGDAARESDIEAEVQSQIEDYFDRLEVGDRVFEPEIEARAIQIDDTAGIDTIEVDLREGIDFPWMDGSIEMNPTEVAVPGTFEFVTL